MKRPTTYEEQRALLMSRGLVIEDNEACLNFLRAVNYYRLTAYLLPFKKCDGTYGDGLTFDRIQRIYEFDGKLRTLLFVAIEEVELYLRSRLAYHFAHTYGATGYLNKENYNAAHDHARFIETVDAAIKNNKSTPVVKHHMQLYNGQLPIWAMIEFFSIGSLSYFYKDRFCQVSIL